VKVTPRRILFGGWIVFLLYCYPGFLQTDGADLLADLQHETITDWYSPMFAALWRVTGWLIAGPAGMLLLQSALFLAGCFHLLRRETDDRRAAWIAIAVLMFPGVLATGALVSPEALLAGMLASASAALTSERRNIRLVGLALIALACGLRWYAALAALPIVFAWFRWSDESTWRRRGIAVAAWIGCALISVGASAVLVDHRTQRNEVTLALNDTVQTVCRSKMSDAEVRSVLPDVELAPRPDIQRRACEVKNKSSAWTIGDSRIFEKLETDRDRDAIVDARVAIVFAAPKAFLAHRWRTFLRVLGVNNATALYTEPLQERQQAKAIGHLASHSTLQSALLAPMRWLAKTPLLTPYLYLLFALIVLPLAAIRRHRVVIAIVASGILYEATVMFTAITVQRRESHWMMAATVLAIALLIARRFWPVSGKTPT
jgi:hypothetical protein